MKILYIVIAMILGLAAISCKSKSGDKGKENVKAEDIKTEEQLIRTDDFRDYVFAFFRLTGPNVSSDNEYVQKFMRENKLLKFRNICDLLDDEKVKSDSIVYRHWKLRCDFQKIKNKLIDKYGLTPDSINKILRRTMVDPPESWHLEQLNYE